MLPPGMTRLTGGFGGPFNGQRQRVAAVNAIVRALPFAAVVETGTFRAQTTLYLRRITDVPIATVEVNPRYFEYSRRRLAGVPAVSTYLGSSPAILERLGALPSWTAGPTLFYLDAHWLHDLPLLDELRVIVRCWRDFCAVIDDFRVPDDEAYLYDDYGPGKQLSLPLLDSSALDSLRVFWPEAHSSTETGARRGWVVLATPGLVADGLGSVRELRPGGVLGEVSRGSS